MPNVVVIAGPNGAGKSTLAPALLRDTLNIPEYVNADTIAEGLSAFAPENASFEAGRVMLHRLNELARQRQDLSFETNACFSVLCELDRRTKSEWLSVHPNFSLA
jgi:predicted ABC-type ATPase